MSKDLETENLDVENEVGAIKAILAALAPLTANARTSVLEYILKRLGITAPPGGLGLLESPGAPASETPHAPASKDAGRTVGTHQRLHIRAFKEQKQPRSANEMAALVAYYLAHLAETQKKSVNAKDIEEQFRIAEYPLPAQAKFTLVNARNAGYLDSAGGGEYELNAVGHNLVAHSLPRGESGASRPRTRKRVAKGPRQAAKRSRKSK